MYNPAPDTTHSLQEKCVLSNDQMHALSITHPSIYVAQADGIEQTVDGDVVAEAAPEQIIEMEINKLHREAREITPARRSAGTHMLIPIKLWEHADVATDARLVVNVSSDLSNGQILQVIKTLGKYNVWDDGQSKLSLPKQSIFEMKIPTLDEEVTFKVEPYRQSKDQMDFLIEQIPLNNGSLTLG